MPRTAHNRVERLDTTLAEEAVVLIKPQRSFANAIGLRKVSPNGEPGAIVKPRKLQVPAGKYGGLNSLWQSQESRNRLASRFLLGTPMIRKCEYCKAVVFKNEYTLCCSKGSHVIKFEHWPTFSREYRQTAIDMRETDKDFCRNCVGVNRYFATAKLVVDSVAPERGDSIYKPFKGGWNIRQAGNLVLAGRSFLMPLERNDLNETALHVNTAMVGVTTNTRSYNSGVITLYQAIIDEQKDFFDSGYFRNYTPIDGDFPPIALAAGTNLAPPKDDYEIKYRDKPSDASRMTEAVSLSTVGSNHYVAPHVTVAAPQTTPLPSRRIRPLFHADPHLYPLFLPYGIGGYSIFSRFEGRRDGQGKPLLLKDFMKRLMYQRFMDFAMFPRLAELLYLDHSNRIAAYNADRMIHVERVYQFYMRRVARMNEFRAMSGYHKMGRHWQLPNSVPGSPAYIKKKLDDGMALIAKFGDPTFFITMTTNKNWPEIKTLLKEAGVPNDPPEAHRLITVRAFRMRLQALESALKDGYVFGVDLDYLQRCVEFQMRGLSHAHIIVRLKGGQPLSSSEIDKFVSARLFYSEWCPGSLPRTDPNCQCFAHKLTRLVSKFMVHKCIVGVCKDTKNGPCKKNFPYKPSERNYISEDSGRWFYTRSREDAYVVPYNISLLYFFECHLNVDCCTGPGSGRYIRKYQCKMADSTMIRLDRLDDDNSSDSSGNARAQLRKELREWFRTRVVSSSEAVTRLLDCTIHRLDPAVKLIYIHLPGDHMVAASEFERSGEGTTATDATSVMGSMLLRYFKRPRGPAYDNLTIVEYYSKFDLNIYYKGDPNNASLIFDQGLQRRPLNLQKCVPVPVKTRKQRAEACAYIVSVQPSKAELYCLRQLLATASARSFDELKNGFHTFREAAEEKGLYFHDKEYQIALQTCINADMLNDDWEINHQLRRLVIPKVTSSRVLNLFVSVITSSDDKLPSGSKGLDDARQSTVTTLFEQFWPYLLRNLPLGEDDETGLSAFDNVTKRHEALRAVANKLQPLRIELRDIGLETPPPTFDGNNMADWERNIIQREHDRYDAVQLRQECTQLSDSLTAEQSEWVHEVSASINGSQPNSVFYLGGNAGTGKSTAIRALLSSVRLAKGIALPCAFMASAASILSGGDTLHRLFKLPVEQDKETDKDKPMQSTLKAHSSTHVVLRYAKLIVIDEISMVSARILNCISRTLQDVRESSEPFGGVCVVLAGDFKQLTPVIKGASRMDTVSGSVTSMPLFHSARKTVLRCQMRVQDPNWNRFSLATGYGVTHYTNCDSCTPDGCHNCHGLGFVPHFDHPDLVTDCHSTSAAESNSPIKDGFFAVDVNRLRQENLLPPGCSVTTSVDEARRFVGRDGFIIAPLNDDVIAHNKPHIPLDNRAKELRAVNFQNRAADDVTRHNSFRQLSQDIMDSYNGHGVPPTILTLWKGARVTLLRNLNPSLGLYNGQHLVVHAISKFLVQVRIVDIGGRYNSAIIHDIPRVTLPATVCSQKIGRKQFPLKLAYAMTVNRSQGQTILPPYKVVVDARRDFFSHGHLYVALTRVQQASQVMLLLDPETTCLSSVVYQSILHRASDSCQTSFLRYRRALQHPATNADHLESDDDDPQDAVDPDSDCDVEPFDDTEFYSAVY